MAKLRWKGDYEADVRVLGVLVKPGDVIEVPDELFARPIVNEAGEVIGHDGYEWPEENWSVVTPPKAHKPEKPAAKSAESSKDGE